MGSPMMMRLAYIVNNYGEKFDGVGAYAKAMRQNFPPWIETTVYSSVCSTQSKWRKILSLGMTKELFRVCRDARKDRFDIILLEYPFVEWQPLIILPILLLHGLIRKKKKFVLSLHEYLRGNKLRRLMARLLCQLSDAVIVSDETMQESIVDFTKQSYVRPIPSNMLYDENLFTKEIKRDSKQFVFFGIVNPKTKAFDEMIEAWDKFNADNRYKLCIISSTKLENIEVNHKKITYVHDADDQLVIETMKTSAFCLLPIKPEVDLRSATFKTACLSGCVCIGMFTDQFQNLPFVIHTDYQPAHFQQAFEKAAQLSDAEIANKSHAAEEWAQQFTPAAVSERVADILAKSSRTAKR